MQALFLRHSQRNGRNQMLRRPIGILISHFSLRWVPLVSVTKVWPGLLMVGVGNKCHWLGAAPDFPWTGFRTKPFLLPGGYVQRWRGWQGRQEPCEGGSLDFLCREFHRPTESPRLGQISGLFSWDYQVCISCLVLPCSHWWFGIPSGIARHIIQTTASILETMKSQYTQVPHWVNFVQQPLKRLWQNQKMVDITLRWLWTAQ